MPLKRVSLLALVALLLSACATTGPHVPSSEVEIFEKVLRARSARHLIAQSLRVEAVGARLLRALPRADSTLLVPYLGLVADQATDGLADALLQLLADPARRRQMAEQGRSRAQEFSWQRISQQILSYYERLLHERKPAGADAKPARVG